jgi:cytochrome b6-f complex iron-sulfur subunit
MKDPAPTSEAEGVSSRRRLFLRSAWSLFSLMAASSVAATVRFFFPRVVPEPPARFYAGRPEEFPSSSVNTEFVERYRVWIVRRESGEFIALRAECTHLGCTPRWLDSQGKFKCPCHGSGFRPSGINFEGPAPRPLDRHRISLTPDGQLEVDRSIVYRGLAGANPDEVHPQSVLAL